MWRVPQVDTEVTFGFSLLLLLRVIGAHGTLLSEPEKRPDVSSSAGRGWAGPLPAWL